MVMNENGELFLEGKEGTLPFIIVEGDSKH